MRALRTKRWVHSLLVAAAVLVALASVSHAQWGRWGGVGEGNLPPRYPPAALPDRDFAFCKLMYESVRYEDLGMGWATDYPYAGINLMTRYSELTTGRVSWDESGEPNHWVVRLTDDELFNCPFIMAADVGTIGFSEAEVGRLRAYLLKGGFLWVDDFWGTRAWEHWASEIGRVLPPSQYPGDRRAVRSPCVSRLDPMLPRCHRSQPFSSGVAWEAGRPRSVGPIAPKPICGRLRMRRAASSSS